MKKSGFTLIELIIVLIVIGILATIAIPQYVRAVERTKSAKARHALGLIAQAEKMYRAEHDTYTGAIDDLADYLEMDEVNADTDWGYGVEGDADTFTVTGTRSAGPADINGTTITLDQVGTWGGNNPFSGAAAAAAE